MVKSFIVVQKDQYQNSAEVEEVVLRSD